MISASLDLPDRRGSYFISEASVCRLIKAQDLITSPAYVVIKAANEFHTKMVRPNQMSDQAHVHHKPRLLSDNGPYEEVHSLRRRVAELEALVQTLQTQAD